MRVLLLHAKRFSYEVREKAIKDAEPSDAIIPSFSCENSLVAFISVERGDAKGLEDILEAFLKDLSQVVNNLKPEYIVIYPYAHLSSNLATPKEAVHVLSEVEHKLKKQFDRTRVIRAPFGWYKAFIIECFGHPLSELSREYRPRVGSPPPMKKGTKCYLVRPDGSVESLASLKKSLEDPGIVKIAEDYCNLRSPKPKLNNSTIETLGKFNIRVLKNGNSLSLLLHGKAIVMAEILKGVGKQVLSKLKIPYEEVTTYLVNNAICVQDLKDDVGGDIFSRDLECRAFNNHMVSLKSGYLSCGNDAKAYLETRMFYCMDKTLTPFKLFSEVEATIVGLDEASLRETTYEVVGTIARIYDSMRLNYRVVFELGSVNEETEAKALMRELNALIGKTSIVAESMDTVTTRDLIVKFIMIDSVGNTSVMSIVALREMRGSNSCPHQSSNLILQTNFLGPVEPVLYFLLDSASETIRRGRVPQLPTWLAPIQARIIPVKETHVNYGKEVLTHLLSSGIRADIDDRPVGLGRRIRDAGKEWIPYIVVIGDREVSAQTVNVRIRSEGKQVSMSIEELKNRILSESMF